MPQWTLKKITSLAPIGLLFLSACATDITDQEISGTSGVIEKVMVDGTRILRAETGRLTLPSAALPREVATDFLLSHAAFSERSQLAVTNETAEFESVTHVKLAQFVDGLRVHGAYAKVAISDRGEVIQSIERLAQATETVKPATISAKDALSIAVSELGYAEISGSSKVSGNFTEFTAPADFYRNPMVEKIAYVDADGVLAVGFLVETWTSAENLLHHTLVGRSGNILNIELRTNNDSYNVFVEDPGKGAQAIVAGPGAGNALSPSGWLGTGAQTSINISGNNVRAYLDADGNNAADAGGTSITNSNFVSVADLTQSPSTTTNRAVAVQNLFYLNNVLHDKLYQFGFNEANANFQVNNFGQGGAGNDPVLAEAQDGSGTNNANMSTPGDGSSPRMQMYLWSATQPTEEAVVSGTSYGVRQSGFGAAFTTTGITFPLASSATDGCTAYASGAFTNKIAIISRGTCNFTVKVLNAQNAGAKGVILQNNVAGNESFAAGGTERRIKIPSGMVGNDDGNILRSKVGQNAILRKKSVAPPMIDGDVDADIVFHEYGHGLTWRMIGGMSGTLAGAIGEGASDVVAFLMNGDDRIGEYSYGTSLGIRRAPYEGYPNTYSFVGSGTGSYEVHNDGEIYAAAMWRVYKNYLAAGFTANDVFADFVNGMNFTPSTPAFEDMRDGMLQATAGTGRECFIWKGFAATGIGVGADGVVNLNGTVTITQSFALPAQCP